MLSSQFLINQKQCCGNGCRMCPYEPQHIQGNQQLQKRWNQSKKKSYTTHMNKINIPMIGLGTWLIPNDEAESITKDAIKLGYKHIDTAQVYQNEEGIGNALKSLSISRSEIYITTKMWPGMFNQEEPFQTFDGAIKACEQSLKFLQVDEIDLYLIHNPFAKENRLELWEAMIELKKQGKVKHIGVSNYNVHHMKEIEESGIEMPTANQIEINNIGINHPLYKNKDRKFNSPAFNFDEVVTLPSSGVCLASNKINKVQSLYFEINKSKVWGLQYHPEITYEKMISLIEFRKKRLIENRKAFKNEDDLKKHISIIKKEILISNKNKRMVELKNWLNLLN